MGRHGSNVSSGVKLRLINYADVQTDLNLRCTHMPICTLCWIPDKILFYALREFPWFPRFGNLMLLFFQSSGLCVQSPSIVVLDCIDS